MSASTARPAVQNIGATGQSIINFLARANNLGTIKSFLNEWADGLTSDVRVWTYEAALRHADPPPGLWIFADVDQLSPSGIVIAVAIRNRLAMRHGKHLLCLNHPDVVLPRRALLETLAKAGLNDFTVYPLRDWQQVKRFPVFIRHATHHSGAISPLLGDVHSLSQVVQESAAVQFDQPNLLIVEYLHTSVNGIFRKYSAFRIGDTIVAHHIFHSTDWHVKAASLQMSDALIAEEREFQLSNPHLSQLQKIFGIAGIDYGRIDYAMLKGRVQTWEINTNPTFLAARASYTPAQLPAKTWFVDNVVRALDRLARAAL